jgi:predicted transcriptional regulator
MSAISIRLPDSLHKKVREVARRDNVSINQMITLAVAEKLSALETKDYLDARAKRGNKAKFLKALSRVPDRAPDAQDTP